MVTPADALQAAEKAINKRWPNAIGWPKVLYREDVEAAVTSALSQPAPAASKGMAHSVLLEQLDEFAWHYASENVGRVLIEARDIIAGLPAPAASGPTEAGDHAAVPTTRDGLLIEALRTANRMSGLFNEIDAALFRISGDTVDDARWAPLHDLLIRRFSDCSGIHLFIAANNLRIDLPDDLRGEPDSDGDDE